MAPKLDADQDLLSEVVMFFPSRRPAMSRAVRRLTGILRPPCVALAVLIGTACSGSSTAPGRSLASPGGGSRDVTPGTLTLTQSLLRTTPLAQNVVVVKTIPSGGGGISVPGTDFQLQIPNGAFAGHSMTFTITAYAGNVVAYDFQPHGVTFLKPLLAVQQLGHTNWSSYNLPAGTYWAGAYFADAGQIDFSSGQALVNEFMSSTVKVGGATMSWQIPHFSGYLVAAGREDDTQY